MKKIMSWGLAATLICSFTMGVTSCDDNSDNPVPAKKKYRLVQRKDSYDNGETYTITDYGYDNPGRVKTIVTQYSRIDWDEPVVDVDVTYTYEDHLIVTKNWDGYCRYFTLNDDGLIIKEESNWIKDGEETPKKAQEYYQYVDGRIAEFLEEGFPTPYICHWEADDLMSCVREDLIYIDYTRTPLSVDHGYMIPPLSSMDEELYMMGYYGKQSKHLESHYETVLEADGISSLIKHDYTYTIADGHIVEVVRETYGNTKIESMNYDMLTGRTIVTTFTYEEY